MGRHSDVNAREELLAVITHLPSAETAEAWREAWEMVPEGYVLQLGAIKLGNGSVMATASIFRMDEEGTEPLLGAYGSSPADALRRLIVRANDSEGWHPDDDPGSPDHRVVAARLWGGNRPPEQ